MSPQIALPICIAVMYGIAGPLMHLALKEGASNISIIFSYGAACVLLMLFVSPEKIMVVGSTKNMLLVASIGMLFAVAFWIFGIAFAIPGASPTAILAIVAAYPLISALIESYFKLSKANPAMLVSGAALIVLGIVVIAFSQQEAVTQ